MGNSVSVGERLTTDMDNSDVVQTLYETIAKLFKVDVSTLSENTRFDSLDEFDEHIMEELRTNFEDILQASHAHGRLEVIISDFNSAETVAELIEVIRNSQIL